MRFSLMHVLPDSDEVALIVPGGERTAIMVPLDALATFLPLLGDATAELGEACCEACGESLPGRPATSERFE